MLSNNATVFWVLHQYVSDWRYGLIFTFQNVFQKISKPCLKVFCQLHTDEERYIESNAGKSAGQGSLTRWCRRFPFLALFAGVWFYTSLLSAVFSLLFDSYVLLADDHVNNVSYFPFMSIKQVVPYFCVLREGYYAIIWLIVRICVFIKDWKLIYSELFILKKKSMENWGVAVVINCTACICR